MTTDAALMFFYSLPEYCRRVVVIQAIGNKVTEHGVNHIATKCAWYRLYPGYDCHSLMALFFVQFSIA